MVGISFKKSQTILGKDLIENFEEFPIEKGTIYITKDQEMYMDNIDDSTEQRIQIGGNIIYKDINDQTVAPDSTAPDSSLDNISSNRLLPIVTSSNNGQILRVVNGEWQLYTIDMAETLSF